MYRQDLKKIIENELNLTDFSSGGRIKFALVYPNSYKVGMSNLGIHIIYELLNSRGDVSCERFFLPEPKNIFELERSNSPILSLETQTPLNKFQIVGFAVSFEQDYFNVVKILKLGKINPCADERTNFDPLIIAGGPCATFNPEPLTKIFDAFVIGEGEEILPNFIEKFNEIENFSRTDKLKNFSEVTGVYVPSTVEHFYNHDGTIKNFSTDKKISRQWVKNLDKTPAHSTIITNSTELNMFLIETARGCGRHCRFCMAGYCFRKPRNRSLKILTNEVTKAEKFQKKIGLMGAAISDYPQINELCENILKKNLPMSVASFRADSVTFDLVKALAESGLKTLTIAPEVGSEKMRRVINKGITEENIFSAAEFGIKAGIKNFRLYFMIGLPFEKISDIDEIANLSIKLKNFIGNCNLTLSVNPFVPKPFTPFQWAKFADKKYLDAALKNLRTKLKSIRGVEIISESPKTAQIQAILSRGDRKIAELVVQSDSMQKFRELLKNIDEEFYLRERNFDEVFAWDLLNQGFSKKYLWEEFKRAENLKSTQPCFENCKRCGVCV